MRLDSLLQFGEFVSVEQMLLRQVWQVSILVAFVFVIANSLCRHRPQLAYWLWMIVLIKTITPPVIATPMSPWNWLQAPALSAAREVDETQRVDRVASIGIVLKSASSETTPPAPTSLDSLTKTANSQRCSRAGEWLVAIWVLGSALFAIAIAAKWIRFTKQLALQCELPLAFINHLVQEQALALGLRRHVQVRITNSHGPAVFGVLKPTLLLPKRLCDTADLNVLQPIIAHELLHIRRHDTVAGLLQTVVQAAWWFHPLVWLANREARRERERCCDCEVIARTKHRPIDYARSLVFALELCNAQNERPAASSIGATDADITERRLKEIVRRGDKVNLPRPIVQCSLVIICGALLLPSAPVRERLRADDTNNGSSNRPLATQEQPGIEQNTAAKVAPTGSGAARFGVRNAPPVVVRTMPVAGADNVDPRTTQLQVTFSKPMASGSWSWVRLNDESFPTIVGDPQFSSDQRTCVVDVQLEENTTYAIWLNHARYSNFRDNAGQSAVPYLFVFKTGAQ